MEYKQLLDAGVHFGHLTRKWNPKMAPYIFLERRGIHILDLKKTITRLERASKFLEESAFKGKTILLIGTKPQAKDVLSQEAIRLRQPYVVERWLGGMLTNFVTIRRTLRRLQSMDKLMRDAAYKNLAKRERLMMQRERVKQERVFGGVTDMNRLPDVALIVDTNYESTAVQEALRLNIPIVGILDTNCDPTNIDFPVPANDDSIKSITIIVQALAQAIERGLQARKTIPATDEKESAVAAKRKRIAKPVTDSD